MERFGSPSILETMAHGDLLRRLSTAVYLFGRSAALEGDAGALPRYSVRSKTPRRRHKHNATSHSCLVRRPTDPCASRIDRRPDRRRSKSLDPSCRLALGTELAAFGMLLAIQFCALDRSAMSTQWELRCGQLGHEPGARHGWDAPASRNRSRAAASEV